MKYLFILGVVGLMSCTPKIGKKPEGCNSHLVRVKHSKPTKAYEIARKQRLEKSKLERAKTYSN